MRDVGAGSAPTQSGTDSPIPLASALGDAAATFDIPPVRSIDSFEILMLIYFSFGSRS